MKKLKKVLMLCAITVIVIATIFSLSACKKDPTVESISVTIKGGGEKIELTQQNATVNAIIGKIEVIAHLSDDTTQKITDFSVEGFDPAKLDTVQKVTIKYEDFTATVSVVVKSADPVEPQIVSIAVTVKDGERVTLQQANATEAAILAKIDVTATYNDNTTQKLTTGLTLKNFDANVLDTVQTVTVKYGEFTDTVQVEVIKFAPGEEVVGISVTPEGTVTMQKSTASEQALRNLLTVSLVRSDESTEKISEYEVLNLDLTKTDEDQTVTIKYEYKNEVFTKTVTVHIEDDSEPIPDTYEVYIIVNDNADNKITLTKDENVTTANLKEQYYATVMLAVDDTVVIKDSDDNEFINYESGCPFNGTATKDGNHTFYVKKWEDGGHSIWVTEPIVVGAVTITVNGGEPEELGVNPENAAEYMLTGQTLTAGDTVVISRNGQAVTYKDGCRFNGTVYLTGSYDFYVDANGIWVSNWIQVFLTHNDETTTVSFELDHPDDLDTSKYSAQYKAVVMLNVGDKITVKDIGGNVFKYENSDFFNGTAESNGTYTFYIKLGHQSKNDVVYTAYAAPAVETLTTNVTETLVLYGVKANNIKAALTVTATWNMGEPSVVTDYKVTNYDKTLLDEIQTVTISYGGKSVEISVQVKAAQVVEINATLVGEVEVIELIGANATAQNILNAITVTAAYNDETNGEIEQEQLTVNADTFNASLYGETQQVQIRLGAVTTTVPVKVIAATPASLELDPESVTVVGANEEEVVAAIKEKLTVSVVMTDGTSDVVTDYTVTLATDFNFADFDTEQSATITCGELTAPIAVHMIKQPKSISVNKNEVSLLETVTTDSAKIAALKKAIVVTLTSTDDSTKTISDYTVTLGAFNEATYTQTATLSYGSLESLTVQVTILPVPKISVKGAAATFMTADTENANKYLSGNIQLKRGETVAFTLAGKAVAFPENFNGTATLNGTYAFTVTVDGTTATVACTAPEYAATLKVGDVAQGEPAVNNGVYTWTVTLNIDDEITVSDNKFGNIKIGASSSYVATRTGEYTIAVTPQDDKTTVEVTMPAYAVTLTVKRAGAVVNTVALTENVDTDKTDGRLAEYIADGLALQKNDKVEITDNEGNTLSTYENSGDFNGTAPRNGDYNFYVKIYEDRNSIWVAVPAKVVTLTVNDKTPITLTRKEDNKDHEEYMVEGLALTADDTVVIRLDGDVKDNYKSGCKFNGTVYLTGNYDFYVCVDGSSEDGIWVNDWIQVFHERNGNITIVPTEEHPSNDGRVKEQRKAEVALLANDKIVVRDIGGNAFGYENSGDFNGTATKDGIYTFYIKIGWERANDIIYTAYAAPTVESLTTNVTDTLVLYGVQANDIMERLTVTAHYNVGADAVVTTYEVEGYDYTKLNDVQTVTISHGGKSVEISVKVMAAYVTEINATYNGEAIELIGAKATAENILKAVVVTATYNDGTTKAVQGEVTAASFNATNYGVTQQVEITFGGKQTTVPVKVIEATASELVLSSQSVTVTGANETEVVAAIKGKLTVDVVMTDESVVTNAEYTVALATGFDFTNVTTMQNATITCNGLTADITVKMISEPKSISPNVNSIAILETSATETARLAAVKAQLVITLTMTDNTTETVTDYAVDFGSFSASNYEAQTVTISYDGVESITVQVTITPVPAISVRGGEATFMSVDPENANRYLSGDVDLTRGDNVTITYKGSALVLFGDFDGTATINGIHTFAVTINGTTATVAATLPAYVATLSVGGVAQGEPTVNNGVYTWIVTLERGNKVTVSDNKFGDIAINGQAQYTATRSGAHTIKVTPGATSTAVNVTIPAYAVTLTVTRAGEVVNTVALTLSTEKPSGYTAQYQTTQLELKKNDVVTITDNDGKALANYENFNGTVPHDGKYDFYVKVNSNSGTNSIWVGIPAAPDKVVTISVSGGEPVTLVRKTDNTNHEEYMITGLELHANESVVILVDGVEKSNYKDCGFNGTADNDGTYDFYVCVDGSSEDGIWVNYHAPQVPGTVVTITVNGGTPTELPFDASKSEYVLEGLMLNANDTVTIKKNGEVQTFKAGCNFSGKATATGYHDFYVGDEGVWVTTAYRNVYCYVDPGWSGDWPYVNAYAWVNSNNSIKNADWPGVKTTDLQDGWHIIKLDVKYDRVKFSGAGNNQSAHDITIDTTQYDLYFNGYPGDAIDKPAFLQ